MELLDSPLIIVERELASSEEENKSLNDEPTRFRDGKWEAKRRETPFGARFSQFSIAPRRTHRCRSLSSRLLPSEICCGTKKYTANESHNCTKARTHEESFGRRRHSRGRPFSFSRRPPLLTLYILFLIMESLPGIDPSVLSNTICKYLEYKDQCESELEYSLKDLNQSKPFCAGEFDNYMCWPHAEAGRMVTAPCPDFFKPRNETTDVGFRYCQPNGSWYQAYDSMVGKVVNWRHIENCNPFQNETTVPEENEAEERLLTNLRLMYSVGYGLSLACLIVALLILGFFKKLHCTRNYIHMNLMISFVLRYIVILVKDTVLHSHYELDGLENVGNLNHDQLRQYCDEDSSTGWVLTRCRLVITLMHYAITVNYFWLLAEGLYLQMLLVFAMSENKYFAGFMVFGWGSPWISVVIWAALRMTYENSGCWDMNDKLHIWWIIRAPIIISIVINFFIFINIVRLIVSKLQAHNMAQTDMKLRLAKSTLALIPLLGIHYIVFLALTEEVTDTDAIPMHLKLAFDMFFSSIQGTLVSILYCFLNSEVRTEVRRAWKAWRSRMNLPKGSTLRKGSTTINTNHSTQVTQLYSRHSTNGGDIPLQENCQSSNSTRSNGDSRQNSITIQKENGNAKQFCRDKKDMNGNAQVEESDKCLAKSTIVVMPILVDSKTNGDIECEDDEPFFARQQNKTG